MGRLHAVEAIGVSYREGRVTPRDARSSGVLGHIVAHVGEFAGWEAVGLLQLLQADMKDAAR